MLEDLDLRDIPDEPTRALVVRLLNLLESVTADLRIAQTEIQRLRDENNRLKGEHGKPTIKGNTPKTVPPELSSERERHQPTERSKRSKRDFIAIDREQTLTLDPATLPPDAEFKGYVDVVVQDIALHTDNVCFHKEKYYSPSTGQSYLAPLPAGYGGEFGPGVKALTQVLYSACQMSEPKIREFFEYVGLQISHGTVSNLLIKDQHAFHAEKDAVYLAGLSSSPWQHVDDTATRVNGQNQHCHIVCNPLHTTYHTMASKDRLTILDVLTNGQPRSFRLDDDAFAYVDALGIAQKWRKQLEHLPRDQMLDETTVMCLLDEHLPGVGVQRRRRILEALAVSAYHAQSEVPLVELLVCDDAPQFTWLTNELALCWVHAGRHYKKLTAAVALHREYLDHFVSKFWAYYHELRHYQMQPTDEERIRLDAAFDGLFATRTGYGALDERIMMTGGKKTELLAVLRHPEVPLHNNPAELGARQRVRKRDVSYGPRSADGSKAWDTFMSLAATSKKLGVSFYRYIHDRISEAKQVPPLADLIDEQARALNLGASWSAA